MADPSTTLGSSLVAFYSNVELLEQVAGVMQGEARLVILKEALAGNPAAAAARGELERQSKALAAQLQNLLKHINMPASKVIELLDDEAEQAKDMLRTMIGETAKHETRETEPGPEILRTEAGNHGMSNKPSNAAHIAAQDGSGMSGAAGAAVPSEEASSPLRTRIPYLTDAHVEFLNNWKMKNNDTKIRWTEICEKVPLFRGKSPTRCMRIYYSRTQYQKKMKSRTRRS